MNNDEFQLRYEETMTKYHDFFEHVRVAFKGHCEDIKKKTLKKLEGVPEEDKEGRERILLDQKGELDGTLSELKQLLNFQSSKMRQALEEIRKEQETQSFDLEQELASL